MNNDLPLAIVRSLAVTGATRTRIAALKAYSDRDWRRSMAWLDDSGLALELIEAVDRFGERGVLPAWVGEGLSERLELNRERVADMKQEFDSLNRAFDRAGVEYAVLKGFSLVPEYAPDAGLRSQSDYDYLVDSPSLALARAVLQDAGFHRKSQSPGLDPDGVTLFVERPLDCSASGSEWYSRRIPRQVEVHLSLWEPRRDSFAIETPPDILRRKRPGSWEGLSFPVLAQDDTLIFQCLHAFHHIMDYWCRPSCFLEIARFLKARESDHEFWGRFSRRLDGSGDLADIAGLVFRLSSLLFDGPIPAEFGHASHRSNVFALWVERYGMNWCLARFPGSKLSLFVHREFVNNPATWRNVRNRRLIPFHRPALVSEPRESDLKSSWKASREQWRFVIARFRYHLAALASYAWHLSRWNRALHQVDRQQACSATNSLKTSLEIK